MNCVENNYTKLVQQVRCSHCKSILEVEPNDCTRAYYTDDGRLFNPRWYSNCVFTYCSECQGLVVMLKRKLSVAFWNCTS